MARVATSGSSRVSIQRAPHVNGPVMNPVVPASHQQEWVSARSGEDAWPHLLRIFPADLNVSTLSQALDLLVERHEALRTTFRRSGGQLLQEVRAPFCVPLTVDDNSGALTGDELAMGSSLHDDVVRAVRRVFDLAEGPVLAARLWRLDSGEYLVLIVVHHIAVDTWSMAVILSDLAELYRCAVEGTKPDLAEQRMRYRDFAVWQRFGAGSRLHTKHVEFWRQQLADRPPPVGLPNPKTMDPSAEHQPTVIPILFDEAAVADIGALARTARLPRSAVLLTAFQIVLGRCTGRHHALVGFPTTNRPLSDLDPVVGVFTTMLPLQVRFAEHEPFGEVLRRSGGTLMDAYAHQDLFIGEVLRKLDHPVRLYDLFRFVFGYDDHTVGPLRSQTFGRPVSFTIASNARYELSVVLQRTEGGISGSAAFPAERVDRHVVEELIDEFVRFTAAAAKQPDIPMSAHARRQR